MSRPRGAHPLLRRLLTLLACTALLGAAFALSPASALGLSLRATLDSILVRYHLSGPGTTVEVWNLETGTRVYSRYVHVLRVPGSNEKLVTAAAALDRWGPAYRFHTALYMTAAPDAAGVLTGNVIIKGYGDPTLSRAELSGFVTALSAAGVRKVNGRVYGDESYFDAVRTVSGWKPEFVAYCGPLSALSLDEGGAAGKRVAQPAVYAAQQLRARLVRAGIAVTGIAAAGRVPAGATLVYTDLSPPLASILRRMGKPSDNFIAEMLTKALGREVLGVGSTAAGTLVQRRYLVRCGVPTSEFRLRDGSGLCYADRLTSSAVSRLLRVMSARLDFGLYWGSLPIAGVDGTLRLRMRGTPAQSNLHGKTGTLAIASCLSGYVSSADHQDLVFSILMNGPALDTTAARLAQDAIGAALARSMP